MGDGDAVKVGGTPNEPVTVREHAPVTAENRFHEGAAGEIGACPKAFALIADKNRFSSSERPSASGEWFLKPIPPCQGQFRGHYQRDSRRSDGCDARRRRTCSPAAFALLTPARAPVRPRGPGPQNPKDANEYGAILLPGAPSAVFATRERGQEGADGGALLVWCGREDETRRKGHLAITLRRVEALRYAA